MTFDQIEKIINETTGGFYNDLEDRSQEEFDLIEQLIEEELAFSESASNCGWQEHILEELQKIRFEIPQESKLSLKEKETEVVAMMYTTYDLICQLYNFNFDYSYFEIYAYYKKNTLSLLEVLRKNLATISIRQISQIYNMGMLKRISEVELEEKPNVWVFNFTSNGLERINNRFQFRCLDSIFTRITVSEETVQIWKDYLFSIKNKIFEDASINGKEILNRRWIFNYVEDDYDQGDSNTYQRRQLILNHLGAHNGNKDAVLNFINYYLDKKAKEIPELEGLHLLKQKPIDSNTGNTKNNYYKILGAFFHCAKRTEILDKNITPLEFSKILEIYFNNHLTRVTELQTSFVKSGTDPANPKFEKYRRFFEYFDDMEWELDSYLETQHNKN